ncbi:hypothetical protein WA158_007007 [Blastocystis sp. Blastoise]
MSIKEIDFDDPLFNIDETINRYHSILNLETDDPYSYLNYIFYPCPYPLKLKDPANKDIFNCNALHIACYEGKIDIIGLLLLYGSSITEKNSYDETPEVTARKSGHEEICELFDLLSKWKIYDDSVLFLHDCVPPGLIDEDDKFIDLYNKYMDLSCYSSLFSIIQEYKQGVYCIPETSFIMDFDSDYVFLHDYLQASRHTILGYNPLYLYNKSIMTQNNIHINHQRCILTCLQSRNIKKGEIFDLFDDTSEVSIGSESGNTIILYDSKISKKHLIISKQCSLNETQSDLCGYLEEKEKLEKLSVSSLLSLPESPSVPLHSISLVLSKEVDLTRALFFRSSMFIYPHDDHVNPTKLNHGDILDIGNCQFIVSLNSPIETDISEAKSVYVSSFQPNNKFWDTLSEAYLEEGKQKKYKTQILEDILPSSTVISNKKMDPSPGEIILNKMGWKSKSKEIQNNSVHIPEYSINPVVEMNRHGLGYTPLESMQTMQTINTNTGSKRKYTTNSLADITRERYYKLVNEERNTKKEI